MKLSAWVIYQSKNLHRAVLVRRQAFISWDGAVIATYRTKEAADAALARLTRKQERAERKAKP